MYALLWPKWVWHINVCVLFRYVFKSRSRSRPGHGLDLWPWLWLRSRSRPGCGLDLGPWLWIRSKSRPSHSLDLWLQPWLRSRFRPGHGLDLDLSHGYSCRSKWQPGLDLSHSCGRRSKPQPGLFVFCNLIQIFESIHLKWSSVLIWLDDSCAIMMDGCSEPRWMFELSHYIELFILLVACVQWLQGMQW